MGLFLTCVGGGGGGGGGFGGCLWAVMCVHLNPQMNTGVGAHKKMYKKKKICSYCVNVSCPFP